MEVVEMRKKLILVGENNGVLMHVTDGLLTIVLDPFTRVVVPGLAVVKYLQAVLAPRLWAVRMFGLIMQILFLDTFSAVFRTLLRASTM